MTSPVLFEELATGSGHAVGRVVLDVPATLNSLSLEMIDLIYPQLLRWQDRADIVLVLFEGGGEKAFCAGGDIQALYHAMVEHRGGPVPYAEDFFTREYRLDYLIHTYPKPTMVLGHGVVMGGGLGILGGCSHRVGSERSRIALPEITIGLFPDAGASQFLARMPRHLALFMGLTGVQLNAADGAFVGLLDYLVPREVHEGLRSALLDLPWQAEAEADGRTLSALLAENESREGFAPGSFAVHSDALAALAGSCDEANLPASYLEGLARLGEADEWLARAAQTLAAGCPTTAHIVVEQVARLPSLSLADMLRMELNIAVHCARNTDFAEGVRALLIEKDNKPAWQYADLAAVPVEHVLSHFESPDPGDHPLADLA